MQLVLHVAENAFLSLSPASSMAAASAKTTVSGWSNCPPKATRYSSRAAAEKKRAEKRLAELDSLIARIYEDRTAEVMTARNFSMLSQKFQQEQKALETKILALNTQLEAAREQTETLKNGLFW